MITLKSLKSLGFKKSTYDGFTYKFVEKEFSTGWLIISYPDGSWLLTDGESDVPVSYCLKNADEVKALWLLLTGEELKEKEQQSSVNSVDLKKTVVAAGEN